MENTQVISAQDKVEKVSKITLWALIGVSILVMALFLLVGYDTPYEENPKFVNPQLTDLLIIWTYALIILTAIATVAAVIYGFVNGGNKSKDEEKGMAGKTGIIAWGTCLASVVIGLIVGISNQNELLVYNPNKHATPTEIILTDTSMIVILVLTIVTIAATIFSMVTNKK